MCFASNELVTSLATTHLPLARVPRVLTADRVRDATLGLVALLAGLGRSRPRIAVCSLNPHAGESELLGDEERRAIVPGHRSRAAPLARRRSHRRPDRRGDRVSQGAARASYDGVVAMYHDQATIPLKLVAFGDAVNVTMGLVDRAHQRRSRHRLRHRLARCRGCLGNVERVEARGAADGVEKSRTRCVILLSYVMRAATTVTDRNTLRAPPEHRAIRDLHVTP